MLEKDYLCLLAHLQDFNVIPKVKMPNSARLQLFYLMRGLACDRNFMLYLKNRISQWAE